MAKMSVLPAISLITLILSEIFETKSKVEAMVFPPISSSEIDFFIFDW